MSNIGVEERLEVNALKTTVWRQTFTVKKMAAPTQPNSPAQNGKFSINYDHCTIGTQVNGDNTTVNNNRPGRSTPSSQESSPIRDNSKSIWSKLLLIICLRMRQWQFWYSFERQVSSPARKNNIKSDMVVHGEGNTYT